MMHPVIEHLLKRKNQRIPINDGRKIALVLFGGVMRGVRGGGALAALNSLGLSHAFDYVFAASAGVPNACYFLSDNTDLGMTIYLEDLCDSRFLKFSRLLNVADLDYVISVIKHKKVLDLGKLYANKSKLFIRVKNIRKDRHEYIELHKWPREDFYQIFRAAISMQYLQRGGVMIGDDYYRDGDFTPQASRDHLQHALDSDATDILVIYNHYRQRALPLSVNNRVFELGPDRWDILSRLERNPRKLKRASVQMERMLWQAFGHSAIIHNRHSLL